MPDIAHPPSPAPWRVFAADARERLDVCLCRCVPDLSRRAARLLIDEGAVTVDGRPARKGATVEPGSEVVIRREPAAPMWAPSADPSVPLEVVREDEHVLIVVKASGIPSVPLSPQEKGTLAGGVAARFPECASVGRSPGDGGLLQRLDRATSGLVLAARDQSVYDALQAAQRRGEIAKRYLALVHRGPAPLPERITVRLAPAGPGRRRMAVSPAGASAETRVREVAAFREHFLIEAVIHRGARHQIRAHLAHAGFPIAGDDLYGDGRAPAGLDRLFLHAHEISFVHPVSGAAVAVRAGLPPDLARVAEALADENRRPWSENAGTTGKRE